MFLELIGSATKQLVQSGKLQAIIEEQVKATVTTIVKEALSSYSDFGKQLASAVRASLRIDTDHLGIDGYNQVVLAIVRKKLEAILDEAGRKRLEEEMARLLGDVAPEQITLSALLGDFVEWAGDQDRRWGDRCTVIIDNERGLFSKWIYLDPKPDQSKYQCSIAFGVNDDGTIYALRVDGKDPKKDVFIGNLYGFEKKLFHLYVAGTRLIVDVEAFDPALPHADD